MSRKRRRARAGSSGSPRPSRESPPGRAGRRSGSGALLIGGGLLVLLVAVAAAVLGMGARQPTNGLPAATSSRAPSTGAVAPSASGPGEPRTVDPAATALTPIEGIACDPREQVTYHAHAHLNIRVDGQLQVVPGDIGLRSTCLFWLHTHQVHGVIHVEAPIEQRFTLRQFFAIWGKPLDATVVADWAVPDGSRLWMFVNGAPYSGSPGDIVLDDLTSIELQVGPAALDPLPYTFPVEFR